MERTAKRSDVAGITISVGSFVLLLALWGLFLQQPLDPIPVNKELNARSQIKTAEAENPKPVNETADALAKQPTTESRPEPPFEPKIDKYMILTFTPILLGLIVIGAVLPWIARLKLPGMEADLQQAQVSIGVGPSGDAGSSVSKGATMLNVSGGGSIDTGPR